MSATSSQIFEAETESGYVSGSSSSDISVPEVFFTKPHLRFLNRQLQHLEPQGTYDPGHMPPNIR